MHSDLQDLNTLIKVAISTSTEVTLDLGGTSTNIELTSGPIDRLGFARRYRGAIIVFPTELTLASSAILTATLGMQHAATSTGPWSDLPGTTSTGRRSVVVGTAASSDATVANAVFQAGVSLVGAQRYVRGVITIGQPTGATSSEQTAIVKAPVTILSGADEHPVDTFASRLLAQAGT